MPTKVEIPDWFRVDEKTIKRINETTISAGQKIPNFVLGGPMCCYAHGLDCQCGGNPENCPPHLQKFRGIVR
jgi:hypothetical protein